MRGSRVSSALELQISHRSSLSYRSVARSIPRSRLATSYSRRQSSNDHNSSTVIEGRCRVQPFLLSQSSSDLLVLLTYSSLYLSKTHRQLSSPDPPNLIFATLNVQSTSEGHLQFQTTNFTGTSREVDNFKFYRWFSNLKWRIPKKLALILPFLSSPPNSLIIDYTHVQHYTIRTDSDGASIIRGRIEARGGASGSKNW